MSKPKFLIIVLTLSVFCLLAALGEPWDERCLAFHELRNTVQTASVWQVRQKIYTSSVERWRHYAPHIAPLMSLLEPSPETA